MNALLAIAICHACGRKALPSITAEGVCSIPEMCISNRDGIDYSRPEPVPPVEPVEVFTARDRDALRAESDDDYAHAMTCAYCINRYGEMSHAGRRQGCARWQMEVGSMPADVKSTDIPY